ncbi:MAG: HD domain-containing phosphohydrolase [Coriobacteriia bacterium]
MDERQAIAMVGALSAARKATHLYPPTHPKHQEAVDALVAAVRGCVESGPFTLNLHLGRLYHESQVLPADAPGLHSIAETLEAHRVDSLSFQPGVSEHDAVTLVEVLGLRPSPTLDLAVELEQRGATGVTVCAIVDEDAAEAEERDRVREQDRALYRRLLGVMRTLTARIQQTGEPHVGEAGVIVEGILARLMDDSAAVLGLATMNGQSESSLFHSINTMIYALTIGTALGIPEEGLTTLGVSALLHDIGKVAFDMNDPEQAERGRVLHPRVGAEILSRLPEQDRTPMLVAYEHHMGADTESGYPEREAGYFAHPYSRMVGIADRYDRLTGTRPDGYGLTPDQAIQQLLKDTPDLLDETLTKMFIKALGVFPIGCLVRLTDHSVGVVCAPGPEPMHPRVRLIYDAGGMELDPPLEMDTSGSEVTIVEIVAPENLALTVSDHL